MKGDTERARQLHREKQDRSIHKGTMVYDVLYGRNAIVTRVNKKTYTLRTVDGLRLTHDKTWVNLLDDQTVPQNLIQYARAEKKPAAAPKRRQAATKPSAKPTQKELTSARELGKTGYWAGKKAPAQDAKILDMCRQRSHDAMMALMTAWSEGWHAEHQKEVDKELLGKGIIMPGMEAATKPPRTPDPSVPAILAPAPAAPPVLAGVPMGLGGGGIPPIPGVGAAVAPRRRKTTAKAATKKPKPPAKKAAKPAKSKNGKTAAGVELTTAQRKRLAADGSITIKRGGKFVTVTR